MRRLTHTNRADPQSALDAKFSLQYVLARAYLDGHVAVPQFEGDAYRDARVRALLPRIHVAPYDASQFSPDNHFAGAVRVTLNDGTVQTAQVDQALGRTSENPLPEERLRKKFSLCAATVLRNDSIAPVAHLIETMDSLADVRELTALIMSGSVEQGKLN